jgi:hypothetical protein
VNIDTGKKRQGGLLAPSGRSDESNESCRCFGGNRHQRRKLEDMGGWRVRYGPEKYSPVHLLWCLFPPEHLLLHSSLYLVIPVLPSPSVIYLVARAVYIEQLKNQT